MQRVPYRINPKRNTPRHILIKLKNTKHKERILKAAREKQQVTNKENPMCLTADLSAETRQARREWQDISKLLKGKNLLTIHIAYTWTQVMLGVQIVLTHPSSGCPLMASTPGPRS